MNQDAIDYIDASMLDNLSQFLNPEKLRALMLRYIEDSTQLLKELASSLERGDAVETRRHIHSLKSTSANVGAKQLAALASELEELARREQLEEVKLRVNELGTILTLTASSIGELALMQQQTG